MENFGGAAAAPPTIILKKFSSVRSEFCCEMESNKFSRRSRGSSVSNLFLQWAALECNSINEGLKPGAY